MNNVIDLFTGKRIQLKTTEQTETSMLNRLISRYDKTSSIYKAIFKASIDGSDQPYIGGCLHNVVYSEKKCKHTKLWNSPHPVPVFGDVRLPANRKGQFILGDDVASGNGSDPLMWMDHKYQITQQTLNKYFGKPLQINTRSDLIGHDDYMERVSATNTEINIYIYSDNNRVSRIVEPGAPSNKRRLKAAKKLLDNGYKVNIVHVRTMCVSPKLNSIALIKKEFPEFNYKKTVLKLDGAGRQRLAKVLGEL